MYKGTKRQDWITPPDLYEQWNKRWGPFYLDPCTTKDNPLNTPMYYTKKEDGLNQPWWGKVYCNPPYGREVTHWVQKAVHETQKDDPLFQVEIIVMLTQVTMLSRSLARPPKTRCRGINLE